MKELISVIVPVYNIEKYIKKCVKSIERQTYENIEIILVDDGSTDKSGIICDELAKSDKRIRVYHQQNKGLSEARNKGIKEAKGEFLSFVDGDDVVFSKMYEKMLETLLISDADFAVTGVVKYYGKDKKEFDPITKFEVVDEKGYWRSIRIEKGIKYNVSCAKLYKKELFNDVEFLPGRVHEDEFLLNEIMPKVDKVAKVKGVYYVYRMREGSITNTKKTVKEIMCSLMALWDRYMYFKNMRYKEDQAYTLMCLIHIIRFNDENIEKTLDYEILKRRIFMEYKNKKNRSKDILVRVKTYLLVKHFKIFSILKRWRNILGA
ncbi:glycosyltransferase family 2 protein [Lachnobacterium bovis]|uniref:Glycosyltransferase involved in cell wall bisynthesis n=1 Tax=Lachnobacterium bovis TaxID=140626 RepID=A0A1H9SEQ7_9FIRM|nr:glycosyltransferase [Lachnobacterium bovis]SER83474.1 Glycosyltransferase involved in cell wall bisynthesis [Lachnobacterium bovis]